MDRQDEGERRRSQRIDLVVKLEVEWTTEQGRRIKERAETEKVSEYGALLRLWTTHPLPGPLKLKNLRTGQSVRAAVVYLGAPEANGALKIGVALESPNRAFWGVSLVMANG